MLGCVVACHETQSFHVQAATEESSEEEDSSDEEEEEAQVSHRPSVCVLPGLCIWYCCCSV